MTTDALRIERVGHVLVLHLDDGKANALSPELIAAISAAIDDAERDESIGAVVIHGREGRFCGGFDLGIIRSGDVEAIVSLLCAGGDLVARLYGAGVPVVAACTGHALAAGALLLLGCDVRIGADVPAKIGLNEVAIQMVLPRWAVSIACERLSPTYLQRAVANARLTGPAAAVDAGFLDEVVAADDVLAAAIAQAEELATALDPRAYRGTVHALRGPVLATMAEQLAADRAAGVVPTG